MLLIQAIFIIKCVDKLDAHGKVLPYGMKIKILQFVRERKLTSFNLTEPWLIK